MCAMPLDPTWQNASQMLYTNPCPESDCNHFNEPIANLQSWFQDENRKVYKMEKDCKSTARKSYALLIVLENIQTHSSLGNHSIHSMKVNRLRSYWCFHSWLRGAYHLERGPTSINARKLQSGVLTRKQHILETIPMTSLLRSQVMIQSFAKMIILNLAHNHD